MAGTEVVGTESADEELVARLHQATSRAERAEAWHAYIGSHPDLATEDLAAAQAALHEGTPGDAIALANRPVEARAREAAKALRVGATAPQEH